MLGVRHGTVRAARNFGVFAVLLQIASMITHSSAQYAGPRRIHTTYRGPRCRDAHFVCRRQVKTAAADAAAFDEHPSNHVNVFPRLRERDPFKTLGIPTDSDFEEVQQARNYLVAEWSDHEASREHIELAYEKIVSQSFRARQKKGYRPGRGKRGERVAYEAPPTLLQRVTRRFDPSISASVLVRDASAFCAFGVWSAATVPQNTAPLLVAFGFAVVRTILKRKVRTPDGPWLADSPAIGAILTNLLGIALATVLASLLQTYVQFWQFNVHPVRAGAFLICTFLGLFNVYIK